MHFNFDFSAIQIFWTLTFAALLVLLVVLLGRDRASRFPLFTTSIALMALRMLSSRMLSGRMAALTSSAIFLSLALLAAIVSLLVAVEIARHAFSTASRRTWLIGSLVLIVLSAAVAGYWGPWPGWKTLTADSSLSALRLMQFGAQKLDIFDQVLFTALGLMVVIFGSRFHAGFRSHTQQIAIGLSAASISQIAVRGAWQYIALHTVVHSQEEYTHVMGLEEKLINANSVITILVLIWWIACLWIDEPGTATPAESKPEDTTPESAPQA
jgi:hypothetical protein